MVDFYDAYGSSPTSLTVTNLHSLANNSFWQSDEIDVDAQNAEDIHLLIALSTNTSVGSATGYCNVYAAPSLDNTTFAADASGAEGSYAPTTPSAAEQVKNAVLVTSVAMKADETTARVYERIVGLAAAFGGRVPKYVSFIIENKTGAALNSSGNLVSYLKVYGVSA